MENTNVNNSNNYVPEIPYPVGTLIKSNSVPNLIARVVEYEIYKNELFVTLQRLTDNGYLDRLRMEEINAFWHKYEDNLDKNPTLTLNKKINLNN